jgi:hypothetical protein
MPYESIFRPHDPARLLGADAVGLAEAYRKPARRAQETHEGAAAVLDSPPGLDATQSAPPSIFGPAACRVHSGCPAPAACADGCRDIAARLAPDAVPIATDPEPAEWDVARMLVEDRATAKIASILADLRVAVAQANKRAADLERVRAAAKPIADTARRKADIDIDEAGVLVPVYQIDVLELQRALGDGEGG